VWWWCWAGKGVKDRLLGCLDLKAEARGFGVGHNVLGGDVSDLRGGGMSIMYWEGMLATCVVVAWGREGEQG